MESNVLALHIEMKKNVFYSLSSWRLGYSDSARRYALAEAGVRTAIFTFKNNNSEAAKSFPQTASLTGTLNEKLRSEVRGRRSVEGQAAWLLVGVCAINSAACSDPSEGRVLTRQRGVF
ncbi:hypothetical protein EYF80_022380 [Liparis tanakae]|uniref:Uncharacterized protein n=1 Tax=Liparis tanakae TaxID=230148 RepID=A0A4Z2HR18_9TELE|nr:hypothetical protein EYF80_022380 [Liparis tanakae]